MQISAAMLTTTGKGPELLKSAVAPMPEGAMADGCVKNAAMLAKAVKELCRRNKLPTNNVVVSLAVKPAILRVMELPKDVTANHTQYLRDELKHYAVMSGKTITHDFCPLSPEKKTRSARVLLAAADQQKVAELVQAFARSGITINAVEPPELAAIRLVHANSIAKKFGSNILVAVLQDTAATLFVFNDTKLDFVHTAQIGEKDIEQDSGVTGMLAEIHTIRQFFDVEAEDAAKKWEIILVVSGENPANENLRQKIQQSLADTQVRIISPATLPQDTGILINNRAATPSPISAGLAMRGAKTGAADLAINLLPAGAAAAHNMQKFALITANIAVIIFLLSLLAIPAIMMKIRGVDQAIKICQGKKLPENITKVMQEEAAFNRRNTAMNEKLQAITSLRSASYSRNWAKLLQEIGASTPRNLRITSFATKDNKSLLIEGQAFSFDQITMFSRLLEKTSFITSAKITKSGFDPMTGGVLIYTIHCSLVGEKGESNVN
jgi:Tfp pilus assembly PilM family ATPase/Tfp pilus assembly protein PilN